MQGNRIDKVNELLQQQLAEFFNREIEFPEGVLVTIIRVETSRDLDHATVLLSILPTNQRGSALAAVKKNGREIHQFLKKKLFIKRIPHFNFVIDDTEEKAAEIEEIVGDLHKKA